MKLRQDKNECLQTLGGGHRVPPPPPVIESAQVLCGRSEVIIRHNGRDYRLRCTRLGKLILTA